MGEQARKSTRPIVYCAGARRAYLFSESVLNPPLGGHRGGLISHELTLNTYRRAIAIVVAITDSKYHDSPSGLSAFKLWVSVGWVEVTKPNDDNGSVGLR